MKQKLPRYLSIAFFLLYLGGGLLSFRDYGVSFDEKCQRYTGGVSAKYIVGQLYPSYLAAHPDLNSIKPLEEYPDRDYGVAFELPLAVAEKVLGLQEDTAALYYMRHLANFLVFFTAIFFFWKMVRRRFGSEVWALLGAGMLALYPRFFAESFYNSKDIIFLSAFIIGLSALQIFLEKRTLRNAIWLGFTAAFATDVRILGIMLPIAAAGILFWEQLVSGKDRNPTLKELKVVGVMLAAFIGFTILMWPFLWSNPPGHFAFAFKNMSRYRWEGAIPFMGHEVDAQKLPPYYLPVWMGITLPLLYIASIIGGILLVLVNTFKGGIRLYKNPQQRFDLVCLLLFLAAPLSAIILGSVLYNGWRQMYFISGPMFMVALAGMHRLSQMGKGGKLKYIVPGLVAAQLAVNLFIIVRLHPFQNVYFNALAGRDHATRYEMDYWGLSYRRAIEYVAASDPSDSIQVRSWSYTGLLSHAFLSPADRERIVIHLNDSLLQNRLPDYNVCDLNWKEAEARGFTLVHEVKAGPQTVNWVYKRKGPAIVLPSPEPAIQDSLARDSTP